MGRIKSRFVKSSGDKIFEAGKDEFTGEFDKKNKEFVAKHAKVPSKKLRNTILGHIIRLAKKAKLEEE